MHFILGANVEDSITTGMGRQMHGLGDALVQRGHQVEYLFAESISAGMGPKLARLAAPFRTAAKLAAMVRPGAGEPVAILHEPIGWPAAIFLRNRIRTLAMVHSCEAKCWGVQVRTQNETGDHIGRSSRIMWPLTELSQTYATLRSANGVLCLGSDDVDFISARMGVPRGRIQRIDNGLEPSFIGLPFDAQPRERDLLFLGSWIPRKGIRILGQALELLSAEGVQASLTLAGTGASPVEAILEAVPAAWRERTEVIPRVPADRLIDVYRRHRIFVLPSVAEGIPLSMLEAMACGLCPIVTSVGGVPDVVQQGRNGHVVPMLDAGALAGSIGRALRDRDQTLALARGAHASMQDYGWDRVAVQVEDFCRRRFASDRDTKLPQGARLSS